LDSWTLRMGPIGYPKTSVMNYHYSLRNNPEQRRAQHHENLWTTEASIEYWTDHLTGLPACPIPLSSTL
jgi:hypothetical protein